MADPDLARDLLGEGVLVAVSPIDGVRDDLLPEEWEFCASFAERRLREFATGRRCARELLGRLGWQGFALGRDPERVPRWPSGIVGSISHTKDLCLVAVASSRTALGLGVDVEGAEPMEPALWRRICTPRERAWLEAQPQARRGPWAKVLFSAKESTFKAWFPLARRRLGPREIEIEFQPGGREFRASIQPGQEPSKKFVGGVCRRDRRWVVTGVALPVWSPV